MIEKLVVKLCIISIILLMLLAISSLLNISMGFEIACEDLRSQVCNFKP